MKQVIIIFIFIFSIHICFGQNLVINPSFEDITSCPTDFTQLHTCAVGWPININSVDLYHTCSSGNVAVPQNFCGYQAPLTGDAYGGFIAWQPFIDAPIEVMGAELGSPLIPGYCCYVSFNVSLASGDVNNLCVCGVDKLGALFTNVNYGFATYPATGTPPVIQNFAHVYTNSVILDTAGWVQISGTFTVDSAYQYIMIGRFFNTNVPTDTCWDVTQANRMAYYYVDDVTVLQSPPMTLSLNPTNIVCNGEITGAIDLDITGGIQPYTYHWSNGANTQDLNNIPAGTYLVTVYDSIGCEITGQVEVTEPTTFTATLIPANIECNGDTGAISLSVSGGIQPYTYLWSNGAITQNLSNVLAGTYFVTVTDSSGCSIEEHAEIVEPDVLLTTLIPASAVCYGQASGAINLNVSGGTSPYTFLWSNGATTQDINNLTAGIYLVTVTDANSCSAIQSIVLTETNEIDLSVSDNYLIVCEGQSVEIIATASGGTVPLSYYWNGILGDTNLTVSPVSDTTIQVYAVDAYGCTSSTDTVTIEYLPYLIFNLTVTDTLVCSGQTVEIYAAINNGLPPYTSTSLGDTINFPVEIAPVTDTIITISVSDQCGYMVTDYILINVIPPVNFSADTLEGCEPLTVQFYENSPDIGQTYHWDFGDNTTGDELAPVHTYMTAGTYDVSLAVAYSQGCSYQQEITEMVSVWPNPDAGFAADPEVTSIHTPSVQFNNLSTGAFFYTWNFDDGSISNAFSPEHTFNIYGTYNVMLIAQTDNYCQDTVYQKIIIMDECTFYAPTAFSPDNDQINDVFYIKGTGIDNNNFKLLIYDRWGEIIYESDDIYEGWNGRIKGEKVKIGSYTWLAIYKTNNGVEHTETGVVTIIR